MLRGVMRTSGASLKVWIPLESDVRPTLAAELLHEF
jgi:hypothetical protein